MKKLFKLTLCAAMLTSLAACSDDDNNPPFTIDPIEDSNVDVAAFYYGDYNDNGTGNFDVNFLTKGMTWDEDEATYYGPGELVYLTFNSTLASNPDQATLTPGTYTFDTNEDYDEMTYSGSVTTYDADGTETEKYIKNGDITVSIESGKYSLIGSLTLNDNSIYDLNFKGAISFVNKSGEGLMSNLTGNVNVTTLTKGGIILWGETFTETSDYCSVILGGNDYNLYENYGSGAALNFGLNITPGSTEIPSGTYTIINAEEADDYDVNTALSGVYDSSYGGYFGTWYFNDQVESSMRSGTVTVTNNGGDNYTFVFDLADGYGHKVTGTWTGTVTIIED